VKRRRPVRSWPAFGERHSWRVGAMILDQWHREVSAASPFTFDAENGHILDLRACLLAPGSQPTTLVCKVGGAVPVTLAHVASPPSAVPLRARLKTPATITCSGQGRVLVTGLLLAGRAGLKRARTDSPSMASGATASGVERAGKAAKTAAFGKTALSAAQIVPDPVATKDAGKLGHAKKAVAAKPAVAKAAAKASATHPAADEGSAPKKQKAKEKAEKPVTHRTLSSGLRYQVLKLGSGPTAEMGKTVAVRYEGFLATGERFDKGVIRFRLGLGEVIAGWDEGIKGMQRGELRRLLVPPRLGYGAQGSPPVIPPNATLVFEVQLNDC